MSSRCDGRQEYNPARLDSSKAMLTNAKRIVDLIPDLRGDELDSWRTTNKAELSTAQRFMSTTDVAEALDLIESKISHVYGDGAIRDLMGGDEAARQIDALMVSYGIGKDSPARLVTWRFVMNKFAQGLAEAAHTRSIASTMPIGTEVHSAKFLRHLNAFVDLGTAALREQTIAAQLTQSGNVVVGDVPRGLRPLQKTGAPTAGTVVEGSGMKLKPGETSTLDGDGSALERLQQSKETRSQVIADLYRKLGTEEGEKEIARMAEAVAGSARQGDALKMARMIVNDPFVGFPEERANFFKHVMINGLMSSPPGWIANAVSGIVLGTVKPFARLAGSALAGVAGVVPGPQRQLLAMAAKQNAIAGLGELYGGLLGTKAALKFTLKAFLDNAPVIVPSARHELAGFTRLTPNLAAAYDRMNRPSGQFLHDAVEFLWDLIGMPGRMNMAGSEFSKQIAAYQKLGAKALKDMAADGNWLDPGEFGKRVANETALAFVHQDGVNTGQLDQAYQALHQTIVDYGKELTLEPIKGSVPAAIANAAGGAEQWLSQFKVPGIDKVGLTGLDASLLFRTQIPFPGTMTQAVAEIAGWSPLQLINPGFYKTLTTGLSKDATEADVARMVQSVGQLAVGGVIIASVWQMVGAGLITGGPPTKDPSKTKQMSEHRKLLGQSDYYTIDLGNGTVIPYKRGNDILGFIVGAVADLRQALEYAQKAGDANGEQQITSALMTTMGILGSSLSDISFLKSFETLSGILSGGAGWDQPSTATATLAGRSASAMLPFSSMISYLQRTGRDYKVDAFQAQSAVEQMMNQIKNRVDQYNLPTDRDILFGEPIAEGVGSIFGNSNPIFQMLAETLPLFPKDKVDDRNVQDRIDLVNRLYDALGGLTPPEGAIYFNGDPKQGKMPGYLREEMVFRATHLKYPGALALEASAQTQTPDGRMRRELDLEGLTLSQAIRYYMETPDFKRAEESAKSGGIFLDGPGDVVSPAAAAIKSIINSYYKKAWEIKGFIDPTVADKQLAGSVNPRTKVNPMKDALRSWNVEEALRLNEQQKQEYEIQGGF